MAFRVGTGEGSYQSPVFFKERNVSGKVVQLLLDNEGLKATVQDGENVVYLPNHLIVGLTGIPRDFPTLEKVLQMASFHLTPSMENGQKGFILNIHHSLKGGGGTYSKAVQAVKKTEQEEKQVQASPVNSPPSSPQEQQKVLALPLKSPELVFREQQNVLKTIKYAQENRPIWRNDIEDDKLHEYECGTYNRMGTAALRKKDLEQAFYYFELAEKHSKYKDWAKLGFIKVYLEKADIARRHGNLAGQISNIAEVREIRKELEERRKVSPHDGSVPNIHEAGFSNIPLQDRQEDPEIQLVDELVEKELPKIDRLIKLRESNLLHTKKEFEKKTRHMRWIAGDFDGVSMEGIGKGPVVQGDFVQDKNYAPKQCADYHVFSGESDIEKTCQAIIKTIVAQSCPEASAEYVTEVVRTVRKSRKNVNAVYYSINIVKSEVRAETSFSKEAQEHLAAYKGKEIDKAKLTEMYGSHYPHRKYWGSILVAFLETNQLNQEELKEFTNKIDVKVSPAVEQSISMQTKSSTKTEQTTVTSNAACIGIAQPIVKNFSNLKELESLVEDYNKKIAGQEGGVLLAEYEPILNLLERKFPQLSNSNGGPVIEQNKDGNNNNG